MKNLIKGLMLIGIGVWMCIYAHKTSHKATYFSTIQFILAALGIIIFGVLLCAGVDFTLN